MPDASEIPPLTMHEVLNKHFKEADSKTALATFIRDRTKAGDKDATITIDFENAQAIKELVQYLLGQVSTIRAVILELAIVMDALTLKQIDPEGGDLGLPGEG